MQNSIMSGVMTDQNKIMTAKKTKKMNFHNKITKDQKVNKILNKQSKQSTEQPLEFGAIRHLIHMQQ